MSRYNDEALSRILSEHAAGTLLGGGAPNWIDADREIDEPPVTPRCCVNQAAFNENDPGMAASAHGAEAQQVALWFDDEYVSAMTPEELLLGIAGDVP
jgi:hypothetical protein